MRVKSGPRRAGSSRTGGEGADFDLPAESSLRLRKLARLGVLGGACLLMGLGRFESYRGVHILPTLQSLLTDWRSFLEEIRERYVVPYEDVTAADTERYLERVLAWVDHVGMELGAG